MRAMTIASVIALGVGVAYQQEQINTLRSQLAGDEPFQELKVRKLQVVDACGAARITLLASERSAGVHLGVKGGPQAALLADTYSANAVFHPKGYTSAYGIGVQEDFGYLQVAHDSHNSSLWSMSKTLNAVDKLQRK